MQVRWWWVQIPLPAKVLSCNVSVKVYLDDYLVNFGFSNVIITSLLPSLLVLWVAFEPQPSHVVEVTYCKITWKTLDKLSISSKLSRILLFRFCRRRRHRMLRSPKLLLPTTKLKRHSRRSRRSSTRSSNFCTIRGFHPEIQKQVRALNNSNLLDSIAFKSVS